MRRLATLALLLLAATMVHAGPGDEPSRARMTRRGMGGPGMGGSMDRNLFPPELVLMNQLALGLSGEQVTAIKKLVGETQDRVLDVQIDLHRATEQLGAALETAKIEEAVALSVAAQAMDLEKRVKTAHLTLMIRVKNLLTEEQQDKARALKRERRSERRTAPPPQED